MRPSTSPHSAESLSRRRACDEVTVRTRLGQTDVVETILRENPSWAADPEVAIELIYTEFVIRDSLGDKPNPAAYLARLPQWKEQLKRLLEIDTPSP